MNTSHHLVYSNRISKMAGNGILSLFLLFSCQFTFGQKALNTQSFAFQELLGEKYQDVSLFYVGQNYRSEWLSGKVILKTGQQIDPLMLRYNCREDQLIWLSPKFGQVKLDKATMSEFQLISNDSIYRFQLLNLNDAKKSPEDIFEVLYDGKMKVYAQRKVRFTADYFKYYQKYYAYRNTPEYNLIINKKRYILYKPKVSSLYETFPELKDKIKQKIKETHTRVKNEHDFIKLLISLEDLFNQLPS